MKEIEAISHPEAAQILTDTAQLRLLEPFFRGEVSLSDVAKKLGMKLNTLLYRVNKFTELGILDIAREVPRKGRATKLYRASAKAFFVPFEATSSATVKDLLFNLIKTEEKLFQREAAKALQMLIPNFGLLITLESQDQLTVSFADHQYRPINHDEFFGPNTPALYFGDGVLQLDFATAKAFQNDLFELYKRYLQQQLPDAQLYAYRLGLTPVTDDSPE